MVTVTVDKTALTSDNDFGTAISDGLHGIGAMQGDRNRNWSLDSPDVGNLLFPENFSPSGFLPTTRVVTYIIEAGNIGGTGSQVEVINSSGHSRSYAPLQSLDYQNGFDFLLVGNSTSEAYKVNTVSILVEAQNRDSDCDGIPDEHDDCPNSDLSQTLVIGGCDTGVANALLDDGCTIADLLVACEELARNHGDYVKCVAFVTNELKKDGVISGKDKGRIQSCAAKSSIGK